MRFSLWMLSNLLRRSEIETELHDEAGAFYETIQMAEPCSDCTEAGTVYVVEGSLPPVSCPSQSAMIFLGHVVPSPGCSCLLVTGPCTISSLMNALLEIIYQLNHLEQRLLYFAHERDTFSQALSELSRFLKNPAYAMDARFKLLAIDSDVDLIYSSLTLKRLKEHGYMPIQTVVRLLASRTWMRVHDEAAPQLLMMEEFYCPFINCAIRFHGQFQGYLIVVGLRHNLNRGDVDLVEQIMPIINHIAQADSAISTGFGSYYENFLLDVIRGTLRDRTLMAEQLLPLGWRLHGRYVGLVCRLDLQRRGLNDAFAQRLAQLSDGKPIVSKDGLYCVFSLAPETSYAALLTEIERLCSVCRYRVGVSDVFAEFADLPTQMNNADHALTMGRVCAPGQYMYQFSDYRLYSLLAAARSQLDLHEFLPDALRRMEKYDLENNMELVPTLHAFLLEERNWVNTAARLHIHRNTLRYRIDRIQELTGLDLENPMQRLSLLFAFAVKQYLELFP